MVIELQHPDVATWRTATPADIDAIHAAHVAADVVDHPSWTTPREDIADTFELAHIDHARDTILALDAQGEVVAFGSAFAHPSREDVLRVHLGGVVRPTLRRRGIGRIVYDWSVARAEEQLAEMASAPGADALAQEIHVYAEEGDAGKVVLAESTGFRTEAWFASMERDMSAAVPDVAVADPAVRVIPYTAEWSERTRVARNDAFRDHWGSLSTPPDRWEQFVGGAFLRPDLSRLAVEGDRVVAFCLASVNEDDWVTLGATNSYIDLIGVVRDRRRRGLAPLVIARTLQAIADAGLERAVLDVDTASPTGANTLYEGLGFHPTERSRALVRRTAPPTAS